MDEENKNLPVPEDPEGPEEAKEPEKLEIGRASCRERVS